MAQTNHLSRRNNVWYYRRRVPLALVETFRKTNIQFSLGTSDLKEAKKLRAAAELKWNARFEDAEKVQAVKNGAGSQSAPPPETNALTERKIISLVRDFVEREDAHDQQRLLSDPPTSEEERKYIKTDTEYALQIIKNRDDPRADELIYAAGSKILQSLGRSIDDEDIPYAVFAEWVRRGLLELEKRSLGRITDDHQRSFLDQAFDPHRAPIVTFGALCEQFMQMTKEEAAANHTNKKWVDKQRANADLLLEIIGDTVSVERVDFDACLHVRSVLSRLPANRNKVYPGQSLNDAITLAATEGKPTLSHRTQTQYLQTLKRVLSLALRKRGILVNPAEDMKPIKREVTAASERRLPFTPQQLKQIFEDTFYRACAQHQPPYAHDNKGWRFWLPLLCLFMGMRPNEACQMSAKGVRKTDQGTWYVDVVATDEEDDQAADTPAKSLKTPTSRRRIPVHPELIAMGFLEYAETRRESGANVRRFPSLKPDAYGNRAKYPLKQFRESYLPKAVTLMPRQSFYSLRHNFRDALRRIGAPP